MSKELWCQALEEVEAELEEKGIELPEKELFLLADERTVDKIADLIDREKNRRKYGP